MKSDKSCYKVDSEFHNEHLCSRQRTLHQVPKRGDRHPEPRRGGFRVPLSQNLRVYHPKSTEHLPLQAAGIRQFQLHQHLTQSRV